MRFLLHGFHGLNSGAWSIWKLAASKLILLEASMTRQKRNACLTKQNQGRYHIGRAAMLLALKWPQEALHELQFAEQLTPKEYQRRHAYINILRANCNSCKAS